jgi:hypothetical protein
MTLPQLSPLERRAQDGPGARGGKRGFAADQVPGDVDAIEEPDGYLDGEIAGARRRDGHVGLDAGGSAVSETARSPGWTALGTSG